MIKRLGIITILTALAGSVLYMHIFSVITCGKYKNTALNQGSCTISDSLQNGCIYDCSFNKLICSEEINLCAVNPESDAIAEILPHVTDKKDFYSKLKYGKPFICETDTDKFKSPNITVLKSFRRYSENQTARHIIGYTAEGKGICGLELSYDTFLRSFESQNTVKYKTDGNGDVLEGREKEIETAEDIKAGVVTSIDSEIQKICEDSAKNIKKGALVVMDIKTGEIKAIASFPSYDTDNLAAALNDENSPLLNRALCSYNAGSVFKLLICQCAVESGISDNYTYNCTGSENVSGQIFRCHKKSGHGYQDMKTAVANSCNTYFIRLGSKISSERLLETAEKIGFGSEIRLADRLYTDSGNLPSYEELELPAEKANFSFGQGKILVNPIQITQMICGIANDGIMPSAVLVKGITYDGINIENTNEPVMNEIMSADTAKLLQEFMTSAVTEKSNAWSDKVKISAKTSTAQTGNYDENGNELCHAWVSGYFPSDNPQYAMTVLVENGGYGNESASPILKECAEKIISCK